MTIDHAAEALRLMEEQRRLPTQEATWAVVEAHVHAQLAIAEQQRIANLIALQQHEAKYDIGGDRSGLYSPDPDAPGMFTEELRDDIKKGLGL